MKLLSFGLNLNSEKSYMGATLALNPRKVQLDERLKRLNKRVVFICNDRR